MTNRFDAIDQATLDRYDEIARDAAARSFPFLKLVAPSPGSPLDWRVGDISVTAEEAIALADEAVMGWVRFANGKPVEDLWVRQLGAKKPARPNSSRDEAQWERWGSGRPKDPWNFQTKLPLRIMTGALAGKVVILGGDRESHRAAISDVQILFAAKRRRPLVRFTSEKRDGENVFDPILQIVSYTEDDCPVRGLNLVRGEIVPAASPPAAAIRRNDMDDDIPFAPEFR